MENLHRSLLLEVGCGQCHVNERSVLQQFIWELKFVTNNDNDSTPNNNNSNNNSNGSDTNDNNTSDNTNNHNNDNDDTDDNDDNDDNKTNFRRMLHLVLGPNTSRCRQAGTLQDRGGLLQGEFGDEKVLDRPLRCWAADILAGGQL